MPKIVFRIFTLYQYFPRNHGDSDCFHLGIHVLLYQVIIMFMISYDSQYSYKQYNILWRAFGSLSTNIDSIVFVRTVGQPSGITASTESDRNQNYIPTLVNLTFLKRSVELGKDRKRSEKVGTDWLKSVQIVN